MAELPWNVVRGFLMGAADVVPGVSGGTVALILHIYERLVESVRRASSALGTLARLDLRSAVEHLRSVEWMLVVPLLGGVVLAVVTLAHLIERLLSEHPIPLAGAFLGLVAGSVLVAWRLLHHRHRSLVAVAGAVAVAVFLLLGLREGTSEATVAQIAEPGWWAFAGAGAVAVCAMILPGISGSFLLVVMGMYGPVLSAVTDPSPGALVAAVVGAVAGLASFSQLLSWALRRHHDLVVAGLIGLMAGSIRVLWPWPGGVDSTTLEAPGDALLVTSLAALAGFVTVALIDIASRRFAPDVGAP